MTSTPTTSPGSDCFSQVQARALSARELRDLDPAAVECTKERSWATVPPIPRDHFARRRSTCARPASAVRVPIPVGRRGHLRPLATPVGDVVAGPRETGPPEREPVVAALAGPRM